MSNKKNVGGIQRENPIGKNTRLEGAFSRALWGERDSGIKGKRELGHKLLTRHPVIASLSVGRSVGGGRLDAARRAKAH